MIEQIITTILYIIPIPIAIYLANKFTNDIQNDIKEATEQLFNQKIAVFTELIEELNQ